ncbi:MAG: hypothetical protein ACI9AR_000375 [Flavobacteriaceae bacterium]|jgi:hypothetical protein
MYLNREVRRVPKDWKHPKDASGAFIPLMDGRYFKIHLSEWKKQKKNNIENCGSKPIKSEYTKDWAEEERIHYQIYQTTTEGTPVSPVKKNTKELSEWFVEVDLWDASPDIYLKCEKVLNDIVVKLPSV